MSSALETIAPDALFITFPVTDGDSSRRPDNMVPPSLSARNVNWHRKMTMEEKYSCRWRNLIGQGIAMLLEKPDKEKYCLKEFPSGYWMFDHNKGPISNVRHDLYLYGSKNVLRFRSPAEFIPHGLWLLTDVTQNRSNCGCKYCGGGGKRTQTQISEALGLPSNRGPMAGTGGGGSRRMRIGAHRPSRPTRTRDPQSLPEDTPWVPLAQRHERKTDPAWRTSSLKLKFVASSTRLLELRSGRRFRIGELVWCAWEEGTGHTFSGSGFNPPFWPAIVLECSLESAVETAGSSHGLYSVIHGRNYSLLRLGAPSEDMRTQFECFRSEDSILPWQAHRVDLPPWPSLSATSNLSTGQVNPYALALQTGKRLSESWAVCSRFPARLPTPSASVGEPMDESGSCFHDHQSPVIQGHQVSSAHLTDPLSATNLPESPPHRSPARLKALSPVKHNVSTDQSSVDPESVPTLMSDAAAPEPSQTFRPSRVLRGNMSTVTENRYEGLWYGAERIWIGDTVRLCPERDAFASSLRLSHMSRGDESWQHRITPSPGAAMRGVLMRIDRIFVRVSDTGSKECAIAGGLYEVAPKNWMDAEVLPPNASPSCSHQAYYPWDMPTTPPPRPSENMIAENGDRPMHPPSFPLPSAPPGHTLRPLLPPYSEIALPVHFIAGRYYPDIFQWRASTPVLPQVPQDISLLGLAAAAETRGVALLSLCALAPGRFNRAVCVDIRLDSRTRMIEESARPTQSESKVYEEGNRLDVDS